MKTIPTIDKFMTAMPHTIGADLPLTKAHEMMRNNRIRHLPVLRGGKLIGILSDRDLALIESLKDVDSNNVAVEEAYTPDPFIVTPSAKLNEVCKEMAARKYGCALVVDNHKLVGIFTWIDGLNALDELLETRLKH